MEQPLVTIGIPVYNEEKFIAETIESAINQTYKNLEIIISDNFSTDNSFKIAQKYACKDKRIRLIKQENNIGSPENFKFVLKQAKGKYFCWLGAHDVFLTNYIQEGVKVLNEERNVVMVYPSVRIIDIQNNYLSDADDDIDTISLSYSEKLIKIAQNLYFCYSIHGLFRTRVIKKIPIKKIISGDHLILFCTAIHGDIKKIDSLGILARKVRNETIEQVIKRYKDFKLYDYEGYNAHAMMAFYHYICLIRYSPIKLLFNVSIIKKLEQVFLKRFGVETEEVKQILWKYLNPLKK